MNASDFVYYKNWEFSARMAFQTMNIYKDVYSSLDKSEKVKLAHQFYDFVFRCYDRPIRFESKESMKIRVKSKRTGDHPFSARVAHRAIMNANLWLLDDFDVFKKEFYKLIQKINVTSDENIKAKVSSDGTGDVKIEHYITERYEKVEKWYDNKKGIWVIGFPLEIPDWYANYEQSKIPATLY